MHMARKEEDISVAPATFFRGLSRIRVMLSQSTVALALSIVLFGAQVLTLSYVAASIVGSLAFIFGEYLVYRYLNEQGVFGKSNFYKSSTCDTKESAPCDSCSSKGQGCLGLFKDNVAYQIAEMEQKELARIFSSPVVVQSSVVLAWCFVQLVAIAKHGAAPWYVGVISFLLSLFGLLGFTLVRVQGVRLSKVQFK